MEPTFRMLLQTLKLENFILLLQCIVLVETISPPEGFKFNCGHDICVYPKDYCNIVGRPRCEVCTLDVCNELSVSSQCEQRCRELKGELEPPTTDKWTKLPGQVTTLSNVVWILVVLVALLSFGNLFCIVKHIFNRWKRKRDKNTSEVNLPTLGYQDLSSHDEDTDVKSDEVLSTAPPEELGTSRSKGSSVSVYQPSPSGQARNCSTRGNYKLLPDTIPESPEKPPPCPGIRQVHPVEEQHVSNMGDFSILDECSLATTTSADPDVTVVKNITPPEGSDDTSALTNDIDGQVPMLSRPSVDSCQGMTDAYTDAHSAVTKVPSDESIASSTCRGSDSGNYSSDCSYQTDKIAMEKRRLMNERNTLSVNV